jgi:SAM-dependent methyltransferase
MTNWDAKYAAAERGLFGEEPNEYVREILARSDFRARSALCLADGDGRNGAWLAGQGLAVTAVDLSEVATEKARLRDRAAGVSVARITADLKDWIPPEGAAWDAVFLISLHCQQEVRNRAIRIAADALSPGGWFVIEGFAKAQAEAGNAGPDDPDILYDLAEIERAIPEFLVIEAFLGRTLLDEGKRHRGHAEIVRFAARKPSAG